MRELPEGMAAEVEEACTVIGHCRLRIERTVILHMVHIDVLHAIKAGHTTGRPGRRCIRNRAGAP